MGLKWQLTGVSVGITLTNDFELFSSTYCQFVSLLWRSICANSFIFQIWLAAFVCLCCMWAFTSCRASRAYPLAAVGGLFTAAASLIAQHRGQGFRGCDTRAQQLWLLALEHTLSTCARAQLPHSTWDLPGSGIEPMSPTLAGGFFTIVPPRKLDILLLNSQCSLHITNTRF